MSDEELFLYQQISKKLKDTFNKKDKKENKKKKKKSEKN
jgi:hypothetical protein